jgi:hypothetical protein
MFDLAERDIRITRECLHPTTVGGVLNYGGDAAPNLNCNGPTVINITIPGTTFPEGSLDPQGNPVVGYNISSKYVLLVFSFDWLTLHSCL